MYGVDDNLISKISDEVWGESIFRPTKRELDRFTSLILKELLSQESEAVKHILRDILGVEYE
jgi:hypothetical protein